MAQKNPGRNPRGGHVARPAAYRREDETPVYNCGKIEKKYPTNLIGILYIGTRKRTG